MTAGGAGGAGGAGRAGRAGRAAGGGAAAFSSPRRAPRPRPLSPRP